MSNLFNNDKKRENRLTRNRNMVTISMFIAISFLAVLFIRIPLILFLKYEPKDVFIVLAGFIFGPWISFLVSVIVSLIELFTISSDGIIGFVFNVLAASSFSCTASYIYRKKHTKLGASIGLFAGVICMSVVMLLWNYILTPLYMHIPRAEMGPILTKAIIPFNLIKGGLNAGFAILLYKPVVQALRKTKLLPEISKTKQKHTWVITLIAIGLILTCILVICLLNKWI